jgi:hypothetical protein
MQTYYLVSKLSLIHKNCCTVLFVRIFVRCAPCSGIFVDGDIVLVLQRLCLGPFSAIQALVVRATIVGGRLNASVEQLNAVDNIGLFLWSQYLRQAQLHVVRRDAHLFVSCFISAPRSKSTLAR